MSFPPASAIKNTAVILCVLLTFSASAQYHDAKNNREIPGDSLGTLVRALEATDLLDLLENRGDFTVFAPSDAAFERLGGQDEWLRPENRQALRTLMSYHVVAGKLSASQILMALCRGKGAASFTTIQGEELLASMDGTDIVLTDCSGNRAKVTSADAECRNLVLHQIDQVVLPRLMGSPLHQTSESAVGSR